jgi:hypothetical protein
VKNTILILAILFTSTSSYPQEPRTTPQTLPDSAIAYARQVVEQNSTKTDARLITLHVKSIHKASSSELTDAQRTADPIFGLHRSYTLILGECETTIFKFITDDNRVDKVQVGKDYTVILGMAFLDMKKHHYNVKDRDSAVVLIPNENQQKEPVQFSMTVVETAEK